MGTTTRALFCAGALGAIVATAVVVRAQDAEAEAAAAKFLVEKGLRTADVPEQWVGTYAGSSWTGATRITVTDKDEGAAGLRRFDFDRITSRDKEDPAHVLESWWVDDAGALVRGTRKAYETGSADPAVIQYEFKGGKVKITAGEEPATTRELPASFLPDELVALVTLPPSPGKKFKFSSFGGDEWLYFTVEDLGEEKVKGRTGEVAARKLVLKDRENEAVYWLDAKHRIVLARWPELANLVSVAGSESQSRSDWADRPADEHDADAERLVAGPAAPESLAGELFYGIHEEDGSCRAVCQLSLKKEERDGKPAFHFVQTIADVESGGAATREEWWLALDGKPLAASFQFSEAGKAVSETRVKVENGKLVATATDAPAGQEESSCAVPPRLAPDAYLFLRALAKEDKGTYRFSGYDFENRSVFSIAFTVKGTAKIRTRAGEVQAKHVVLLQNAERADCWIDATGKPLLAVWSNEDVNEFADSLEAARKKLEGRVGPPRAGE